MRKRLHIALFRTVIALQAIRGRPCISSRWSCALLSSSLLLTFAVLLLALTVSGAARAQGVTAHAAAPSTIAARVDHADLSKLHWQLACQAGTFQQMTTSDMIDLLHALNVHHIELSLGQTHSSDYPDIEIGPDMGAEEIDALNAKLKSVHMDAVSLGDVTFNNDEAHARKIFDLGRQLKIKNIIAVRSEGTLEMLDTLSGEYGIRVAIVNDAKASRQRDFDALVKSLQGRSDRVGVCADVANWKRSGLDPVRYLQKLGNRVIEVRFADIDSHGQEVPLGSGTVGLKPILSWLKNHNFAGICSIEYLSGSGQELTDHWIMSVNAFSDTLAAVASGAKP